MTTKKQTFRIISRWDYKKVLWEGKAENIDEAVLLALKGYANLSGADLMDAELIGANLSDANFSNANLSDADLIGANLSDANFSYANLSYANLRGADLMGANLSGANLSGADLSGAELIGANLSDANLSYANFSNSNLSGVDLSGSDLIGANLSGVNLSGANLSDVDLIGAKGLSGFNAAKLLIVPQEGDIIGWKKLRENKIAKLLIPNGVRRHNATGRKCRCEKAKVLEIFADNLPVKEGVSQNDPAVKYIVGEWVKPTNENPYDPDRWNECSGGIHFFITREEAEAY